MYKILLIIILILIVYIITMYDGNKYEKYTEKQYDFDRDIIPRSSTYIESESIEYPIRDAYLTHYIPIDDEQIHNIYDYKIIRAYRAVLDRSPTKKELKMYRYKLLTQEVDETFMITILYNTIEYKNMKETQINAIEYELEFETYERMLYETITLLYFKYHNDQVYDNMLPFLKSLLVHFQFDMYIFIACLSSEKYKPFETEVLETTVMNKFVLHKIFYKHFILLELHNRANAIKQSDLRDGKSGIFSEIFDGQKLQEIKDKEDAIKAKEEEERQRLAEAASATKCVTTIRTKKMYNPISHNMPYRTRTEHNPPICTTLGNKYNYKEYENKNYTTVEESIETDIGSIMPKFKYNEYVDVPI
jgi:hypothetical protein